MQDIIAILIVTVAAAFLAYRGWQRAASRRAGACGACSHCPSSGSLKSTPLVTLSPIIPNSKSPNHADAD
jgi:hypothetical protein